MRKQSFVFFITLGVLLIFGSTTWIGPSTSLAAPTAEETAQQALPEWLDMVRRDDVKGYGFKDESELDIATVGTPYQVFKLAPETVQAYQDGQSVSAVIHEEPWWEFPVLVHGQARGLLTVKQVDGQWQAVGFGAFVDSQKIVRLQERLAKHNATVKLIKFAPLLGTFALIEQDKREKLVYLSSLPGLMEGIDRDNLTAYDLKDFMPKAKKAVDDLVAAEQEMQKQKKEKEQAQPTQ